LLTYLFLYSIVTHKYRSNISKIKWDCACEEETKEQGFWGMCYVKHGLDFREKRSTLAEDMNPFVNPNKRDVTLPAGCKDLIDVLKQPKTETEPEAVALMAKSQIGLFIQLILFQAYSDRATEIVIGPVLSNGGAPIRYKVDGTWHDMSPFPSHIRPRVINELAKMAKFPAGQISGKGFLEIRSGSKHMKWVVTIGSAEGECVLERATD
jgi:type II secretory ATPase GspE/PulE/Tfp pilus assembly ATPase PilB-like protein